MPRDIKTGSVHPVTALVPQLALWHNTGLMRNKDKHTCFYGIQRLLAAFPVLLACFLTQGLCLPQDTAFADPYKVGFTAFSSCDTQTWTRMDIAVWYPTESKKKASTIPDLPVRFRAVRKAKPAEGTFPLILISHPSSGTRFSAYDTALDLAREGYVVAALTHPKDNLDHMPHAFSWDLLSERVADLSALIDVLLANETIAPAIDAERIGIAGFGNGAAAALIMGGALPSCSQWASYCPDTASSRDTYCNKWAKDRITTDICGRLPVKKSLADRRIKAVCAVKPGFPMLFPADSLRYFYPALLLVTPDDDASEFAGMEKRFQLPPEHLRLAVKPEGALQAPCPEDLATELPALCLSVKEDVRKELHAQFTAALIRFCNTHLKMSEPKYIPEPPDLTPPPPPKPEPQKKGKKQSGKKKARQ